MSKNTTTKSAVLNAGQINEPEVVGRKYQSAHFEVQSRRVQKIHEGNWFGSGKYGSKEKALAAIQSMGSTIPLGGGFCASFQGPLEAYEYRIKLVKCENEIIYTEFRKL